MIFLQIFCALVAIAFIPILLIAFNLYVLNWLYLLAAGAFILIYSGLIGFVFFNFTVSIFSFLFISTLYVIRMIHLNKKINLKKKGVSYPIVQGMFKSKEDKIHLGFIFPLSFLNILKKLPKCLNEEINKQMKLDVPFPTLIAQLQESSIGTKIEVTSTDASLYFVIE